MLQSGSLIWFLSFVLPGFSCTLLNLLLYCPPEHFLFCFSTILSKSYILLAHLFCGNSARTSLGVFTDITNNWRIKKQWLLCAVEPLAVSNADDQFALFLVECFIPGVSFFFGLFSFSYKKPLPKTGLYIHFSLLNILPVLYKACLTCHVPSKPLS